METELSIFREVWQAIKGPGIVILIGLICMGVLEVCIRRSQRKDRERYRVNEED